MFYCIFFAVAYSVVFWDFGACESERPHESPFFVDIPPVPNPPESYRLEEHQKSVSRYPADFQTNRPSVEAIGKRNVLRSKKARNVAENNEGGSIDNRYHVDESRFGQTSSKNAFLFKAIGISKDNSTTPKRPIDLHAKKGFEAIGDQAETLISNQKTRDSSKEDNFGHSKTAKTSPETPSSKYSNSDLKQIPDSGTGNGHLKSDSNPTSKSINIATIFICMFCVAMAVVSLIVFVWNQRNMNVARRNAIGKIIRMVAM